MIEQEWKNVLADEGFKEIYVRQDGPNVEYPDHTHQKLTVHVILAGEMTLNDHGKIKNLKAGDRFEIKAGTMHSAKMGASGCKYIVGEK